MGWVGWGSFVSAVRTWGAEAAGCSGPAPDPAPQLLVEAPPCWGFRNCLGTQGHCSLAN